MIMNKSAFNCMCFMISAISFNIWFWALNATAGKVLLITIGVCILGNLTAGKVKKK